MSAARRSRSRRSAADPASGRAADQQAERARQIHEQIDKLKAPDHEGSDDADTACNPREFIEKKTRRRHRKRA